MPTPSLSSSLPELLAPCGNMESLRAAVSAGADAVYFGGTLFNARMHAKNFSREDIRLAVDFCHAAGVRCYVTLNTLLLDRQMAEAAEFAYFLYTAGVDALILTDLGLAAILRRDLPDFPLHASTQLSGHNADAAAFLAERGFSRMVCARELSEKDLSTLAAGSPIGIEAFVHGALCVSHSGQCLLSAMFGGRSGNRGECAQPCRLPYNGRYPLSLKDNCLAGHLQALCRTGVVSLKIEGRMKSPAYVASTVSVYRRLLDEGRDATPAEIAAMAKVFSRDGFTDGYFTGKISPAMLGTRSESDKTASESGSGANAPTVQRDLPPIVVDRPAADPPQCPKLPKSTASGGADRQITNTARFYRPESIPANPKYRSFFEIIYLPLDRFDPAKANGVLLPPVIFDREMDGVRCALEKAEKDGASHVLVTNPGQFALLQGRNLRVHCDFRFGCSNSYSASALSSLCESLLLSPELILPQIRDISVRDVNGKDAGVSAVDVDKKEVIVYGRLPLMLLEKPVGTQLLRDRKGSEFPILREGGSPGTGTRDILLNSLPIYMADRQKDLATAGILRRHFLFTVEGPREVEAVIDAYRKGLPTKKEIRRIK